jgi:DNA primase
MPRVDYTAGMKAILRDKKKRREIKPNPVLDESVLNDYFYYGRALPYQKWIDEGISYDTQMMYGIGFDIETRRVTIPLRNRFGQLVGLKGRIMRDEDDHRKYMYILRCQNRYEWFNFHYAHPYILMDKKVFIFEAEKSPMIAFDMGIFNTVGIGASEISDEQVQIIKQLGLDIEIVLCYDKGISLDDIQAGMELFEGRTVYAIYDKDDLLDGKDSPVDEGKEKWDKLVADYTFTLDEIKKMNELSKEDEKKVEKEVYIIEEWE